MIFLRINIGSLLIGFKANVGYEILVLEFDDR